MASLAARWWHRLLGGRIEMSESTEPRRWLYGLTADEWLHLAAEGEDSEVTPCCGNLGGLREQLNLLATFQSKDDTGWHLSVGRHILAILDGDGDGHNLQDGESFPLLRRVVAGIRAQDAYLSVAADHQRQAREGGDDADSHREIARNLESAAETVRQKGAARP